MQSSFMSPLGYSGFCDSTPCRTQYYVPVTPVALCSGDVNPAFGLCLPSSYQGNLWLLDNCQESYREAPRCESWSCEPKICTTGCDLSNSCVPCNSPTLGKVCSTCETKNISARTSCSPCTQAKGYVLDCYPHTRCASKTCQTFRSGSNCFGKLNCLPKIPQTLSHCRLGSLGYRSFQNLGIKPSAFSPSCYISSRCRPQYNLTRNCRYLNYGSMSCRPLGYFPRNFRSLSCIPSTFPPLRYLCSGSRPLNCY
ncbi:keratin-associated protein 24-1 [Choloepus didactylus]|uniref:keratin-associated protein 24-1 n=1 Tax=Choloepus didactylus TaxID=27675 RepID=UPI00189C72F1|nr:keratin-associated protein 24-1 [Choloepus didactylus]